MEEYRSGVYTDKELMERYHMSNLRALKEKLSEKEFEKLAAEVAPRAEEIVGKLLK